ncbi:UDP-glucose:glycoprotein glucosyltransferase [Camellia lanceoleosa]|uniref:UDP-glucose:glycoprotein glucosyltransferase n=1 Tax=Camellia lanceoleosa TaxID=1840588 RepID=A0ACC0ISI1_9ERIC|nr:UDP-glucose:glycoprotein glucosyltransferase [Camellia lanceoleosa]
MINQSKPAITPATILQQQPHFSSTRPHFQQLTKQAHFSSTRPLQHKMMTIEGSKNARLGMLFNANSGASFPSLLFVKASEVVVSSYSHKAKVLDFLDQLCAFYEQEYVHASSVVAESNEAFIDKVCDLADANALSSKMLRIRGFRVVCAIE